MNDKYSPIRLKNQLCFPLYVASNKIIRRYRRLLKYLDLTYTQYLVMVTLWETDNINEKFLCDILQLKSNTLAPLLKRLKEKNLISVTKNKDDERHLVISLTKEGRELKEKAVNVPKDIIQRVQLTDEEKIVFTKIIYKILGESDIDE